MKKNILLIFILIILILPSILSLIHPGFPLTDDGNWMIIRFSAFYEAVRGGQFPVRFLPRLNYGLGYPVADFLYPLFMYIGVPVKVLGFSFVDTIKIILGLSLLTSVIFSYFWLRERFDKTASFVGAICYGLFPYHLWDLYKRGSVGEMLALSIIPFLLWVIEKKSHLLIPIGYALLIMSHNTLALIFIPIIYTYSFIIEKKLTTKIFLSNTRSFALGLGLSSFFWIPAFYDRQYTVFDKVSISNSQEYFVNFSNLDLYGPIFVLAVLCIIYLICLKKTKELFFMLVVAIVAFFLSTEISNFLWDNSFLNRFVQFPFRFVSIAVLFSSFSISYLLNELKSKQKILFSLLFFFVILFSAKEFLRPNSFQYYPDGFYSTNQDSTTVKSEYTSKWMKNAFYKTPNSKFEIIRGKAQVSNFRERGTNMNFDISTNEKSLIQINNSYFPGWKVEVNGKNTEILFEKNGLIQFEVNSGSQFVKVYFSETWERTFANLISLGSIGLMIYFFLRKKFYEVN